MIIDFSTARPTIAELKAAGVTAVMRYIGWDGVGNYPNTGKNITKAEADGYISNGIAVGLVFEYLANAAALGAKQGEADGQLAKTQLEQLQAPVTTGVYFAVDYDIPDYAPSLANTPANALAKLGPIGDYFAAIKRVNGGYRIGVYGGYWAVKRVMDAGLATMGWQTVAWSGGNIDPRINLLQTVSKAPIVGADVNLHEQKQADFGQWPHPVAAPSPTPTPTPSPTPKSITVDIPPGVKGFTLTWH
jgi:hypothetical protein